MLSKNKTKQKKQERKKTKKAKKKKEKKASFELQLVYILHDVLIPEPPYKGKCNGSNTKAAPGAVW